MSPPPLAPNLDIRPEFYTLVETRSSNFHGIGLFAVTDIPRNARILRFGGVLRSIDERYSKRTKQSSCICISENTILCEDSTSAGDPSDYINHSCAPVAGMLDSITLVALTEIKANIEITVDYAFWEGDPGYKMKTMCTCKAPECRRIITGNDWKLPTLYNRYYKAFSPFLQRRIDQKCSNSSKGTDPKP